MMTGQGSPAQWRLALPDLASRLQGTSAARIERPDEALLGALFTKLFADRQINPGPEVIPYLARFSPRSFDAARTIVDDIDRAALSRGAKLTRKLAQLVLAERAPDA